MFTIRIYQTESHNVYLFLGLSPTWASINSPSGISLHVTLSEKWWQSTFSLTPGGTGCPRPCAPTKVVVQPLSGAARHRPQLAGHGPSPWPSWSSLEVPMADMVQVPVITGDELHLCTSEQLINLLHCRGHPLFSGGARNLLLPPRGPLFSLSRRTRVPADPPRPAVYCSSGWQ